MNLLYKLGKSPNESFRYFMYGLLSFVIGIAIFFNSEHVDNTIYYLSLGFIGLGCLLAIWGYIGIFSARLLMMLNRHPATSESSTSNAQQSTTRR